MKRIGERVKKRREHLQIQLNDLSLLVGVTSSALSQIENAKAFPSIITLKKIADSLHTTVGELIGEHETLTQNPLIRSDKRNFVKENESGARLYLLSHHDTSKQMETYMITFVAQSNTEDIMHTHSGQAFIYLLTGKVEISMDQKKYVLSKGDSFYMNSNTSHQIINIENNGSELLWIISPPNI